MVGFKWGLNYWTGHFCCQQFFSTLFFRKELRKLPNRKEISIKRGETSVCLSDLEGKIDQELDTELDAKLESIRGEIEMLKQTNSGSSVKTSYGAHFVNDAFMNTNESKADPFTGTMQSDHYPMTIGGGVTSPSRPLLGRISSKRSLALWIPEPSRSPRGFRAERGWAAVPWFLSILVPS